MLPSVSILTPFSSTDDHHRKMHRSHPHPHVTVPDEEDWSSRSAKTNLLMLSQRIPNSQLQQAIQAEIQRLCSDHERLLTMLQQRTSILERQNDELRGLASEHQRRYDKAVREMQFFKKKYDKAAELNKQHVRPRSLSIGSHSSAEGPPKSQPSPPISQTHIQSYPLTPTSPLPSSNFSVELLSNYPPTEGSKPKPNSISRATGNSIAGSVPPTPLWSPAPTEFSHSTHPPIPQFRQHSITSASIHSSYSSSTEGSHYSKSSDHSSKTGIKQKQSWQFLQQNPSAPPSTSPSVTISAPFPSNSVHSVPMTPVRSSTATNGYTGASLIQQRRVDPLLFGGSDALWETIAKSQGSDVTVEKIISNFLRRGGSPNTAKQSPSAHAVKYGYGMIHALIVTKAPGSLDLLLQQGANPNVMTLSQVEEDKVSPCFLAASVGWLSGLQKLVQAGGDLMTARGGGTKNKTALHTAAEHCHAAVVEYIVSKTQGALNLELDSGGASVLHYACASGHTDLVSFLARSCQIPVNQPDQRGELPIHWAARHGRLEVVTLLIERCGCDCNAYVPRKVPTPLDLAKAGGHKRLVDYIKGAGGLTAKKLDKRREEELAKEVPEHLESTLAKNGFSFLDD
ncbi:ankyrin repeat-containing domain protein [Radiomyces spectabilis]|uniref:ankyrin repeat-containing domain protein n=1 Tax=Radiomyces spectabilis TaxID=64574 RepID=UPI00221F30C7|nr:ankyrin repeat-containing domain protein [Radiomyces spectabilis]KAI8384319.1 ankyrin repeat-containing domain protein [Radiomyces spectabilis]